MPARNSVSASSHPSRKRSLRGSRMKKFDWLWRTCAGRKKTMSLPEYALYSDLIAGSGEVSEGRHIVAHHGSGGKIDKMNREPARGDTRARIISTAGH